MLLKLKSTGSLVEACSISELTDPCRTTAQVKNLKGYRDAEPVSIDKAELSFVSGEDLPNCWMQVNVHHRHWYNKEGLRGTG
ncbi:hypothetical protein [Halioxenophilus sp. WMMB6]|uniref:hypothetical protein n=1 Tax=Halioxenophilus sp. WMMB6 TaxID=3073815 RepID=UPI00295F0024|nr:hypothetical protein [Halioxenophilus sp. WMMB6]